MDNHRKTVRPMSLDNAPMLPGHYECLTTQLNITTYRAGMSSRFVTVTRLPQESMELLRTIGEASDWIPTYRAAQEALTAHLEETRYLMGWSTARGRATPPKAL